VSITNYFVRATNGADVAGQGTTHMTAYQTPQFALDDIGATHGRNTVDGDQINICDSSLEGANVLAAPLTLATYGTPATTAPLILRGYTAVANDGGMGEINCGGATMWASSYNGMVHLDLNIHNGGTGHTVSLNQLVMLGCQVHEGAQGPTGANSLVSIGGGGLCAGNYIYGCAGRGVTASLYCPVIGNYLDDIDRINIVCIWGHNNIVRLGAAGAEGIYISGNGTISGNIVYNAVAGINYGLSMGPFASAFNNILVGFSGVGGKGIRFQNDVSMVGYNAFYNNIANYDPQSYFSSADLTAHDVALAADPFVDAANGNFALTDAAKLALRSAGWPASYLGAATDPHITIGAVQYGEAGGGVIRRAMRMIGG